MKFVDEVTVRVKAGDGGRGCVSFRHEPYVPKGGPDGGDGGKGGDVIIVGKKSLISLLDFKYKRTYKAENGTIGKGQNRTGRNGRDLHIQVPVGTVVCDEETAAVLADIVEDGQIYVAAAGGIGGRGNARFATPVHRTPQEADPGRKGEEKVLGLELKLLADVGVIGLPNAGKSTLLAALTGAKPEIGDYPFTTLSPALGVFVDDEKRLVIADIPGIIEGASEGKGLGLTFLRHIERTGFLLWVIDASSASVLDDYDTLREELARYRRSLLDKERIMVLNKADLVTGEALALKEAVLKDKAEDVVVVSALTGSGIGNLKNVLRRKEALKS